MIVYKNCLYIVTFSGVTTSVFTNKKEKISLNYPENLTWPQGYKTFFVLNSIEHEILNAHKYKNIKKLGFFQVQISLECYFSRS